MHVLRGACVGRCRKRETRVRLSGCIGAWGLLEIVTLRFLYRDGGRGITATALSLRRATCRIWSVEKDAAAVPSGQRPATSFPKTR